MNRRTVASPAEWWQAVELCGSGVVSVGRHFSCDGKMDEDKLWLCVSATCGGKKVLNDRISSGWMLILTLILVLIQQGLCMCMCANERVLPMPLLLEVCSTIIFYFLFFDDRHWSGLQPARATHNQSGMVFLSRRWQKKATAVFPCADVPALNFLLAYDVDSRPRQVAEEAHAGRVDDRSQNASLHEPH